MRVIDVFGFLFPTRFDDPSFAFVKYQATAIFLEDVRCGELYPATRLGYMLRATPLNQHGDWMPLVGLSQVHVSCGEHRTVVIQP